MYSIKEIFSNTCIKAEVVITCRGYTQEQIKSYVDDIEEKYGVSAKKACTDSVIQEWEIRIPSRDFREKLEQKYPDNNIKAGFPQDIAGDMSGRLH